MLTNSVNRFIWALILTLSFLAARVNKHNWLYSSQYQKNASFSEKVKLFQAPKTDSYLMNATCRLGEWLCLFQALKCLEELTIFNLRIWFEVVNEFKLIFYMRLFRKMLCVFKITTALINDQVIFLFYSNTSRLKTCSRRLDNWTSKLEEKNVTLINWMLI